jgi:Zn-dependent protease with chaperone function
VLESILNHFRLTWALVNDQRVGWVLKAFLVGVPVVYSAIPLPDDIFPVVGLLDDMIFIAISTIVFVALCPSSLVEEHRRRLSLGAPLSVRNLDPYRYPMEHRDLAVGFGITFGLMALGGWLAGFLALLLFGLGYFATKLMRGQILGNAVQVTPRQLAHLYPALERVVDRLPGVKVNLFVTQNPVMNAYTFGYDEPYTIVLTSALVEKLDEDEIQAVIGHEMGHILFGHVRLINLMAGLAGLLRILFYQWSRSCEYSADAVALLAMDSRPEPVVSALLKLTSGLKDVQIDLDEFLNQVDGQHSASANAAEVLSTHPFISNRIRRIARLAEEQRAPRLLEDKTPASAAV